MTSKEDNASQFAYLFSWPGTLLSESRFIFLESLLVWHQGSSSSSGLISFSINFCLLLLPSCFLLVWEDTWLATLGSLYHLPAGSCTACYPPLVPGNRNFFYTLPTQTWNWCFSSLHTYHVHIPLYKLPGNMYLVCSFTSHLICLWISKWKEKKY